jgi:serine/threonine protein kinase
MHDFGRYQLLERIPNDTFARVSRAVERTTGAEVRIYYWKLPVPVLSPRDRRTQDKINELLRAATYLSQLSHPGIARIFDSGESDGWFYLATEMIEGAALKFIPGALDAAVSLDMLRQRPRLWTMRMLWGFTTWLWSPPGW